MQHTDPRVHARRPWTRRRNPNLGGLRHFPASAGSGVTRQRGIAVVLALVSKRARVALAAAVVIPSMYEWATKRPDIDPLRYTAMRMVDDTAYGTGVWRGTVERRHPGAVTPDVSSWPSNAK